MTRILIPVCAICAKPLTEAECKVKASAHFPCVIKQMLGR